MMAQIDVGGAINNGLNAASDAGVVISTLVFLTVLVGCVAYVANLIIGNIKEARAITKAEKEAERAARAEERKATADALRASDNTNRELLERLEQMAETQQQMADTHKQSNTNQETLTESIGKLMTAINDNEETRAQRYAEMFQQRAEDHKAVGDVTEALKGVQTELAGLTVGLDTLKEAFENKIGLTESDRSRINVLVEKTEELLTRIKENEHAQNTQLPTATADHPLLGDGGTGASPDAGAGLDADAGGNA
jgi:chromosome segregation ATPase